MFTGGSAVCAWTSMLVVSRIVNVTSHAVKAPVAMLALSNGARTGLTGFVAGLARSVAEQNVTINHLCPAPSIPTG
jgi:NAD(P)-dependent dehydrogenase (short-subunit alcohol dehydrogenase family)